MSKEDQTILNSNLYDPRGLDIESNVKDFITKLEEERSNIYKRIAFLREHSFLKEIDFLQNRIMIINIILDGLSSVVRGRTKGIEVKFVWM